MTVRSPSYLESTSMIRNLSSRFSDSGEGYYIVYSVILCAILFGIWWLNQPKGSRVVPFGKVDHRKGDPSAIQASESRAYWKRIICYTVLFVFIIYGLRNI